MDLQKIVQFAETYVRDYVISIFSIMELPKSSRPIQNSAEDVLTINNSKTWLYAIISILLGSFAFSTATSKTLSSPDITIMPIVFTLWLWILFSIMSHVWIKLFGGSGNLMNTVAACLRILPAVYVISSLLTLTITYFSRAFISNEVEAVRIICFLLSQFIMLTIYLPASLGKIHGLGIIKQLAIALILSSTVLGVNAGVLIVISPDTPMGPALSVR